MIPPPRNSGSSGCGASANSYLSPEDNGVQVINQQVVGPYEVATLRSTDAGALENWLAAHGYEIPASVQPTIAAYVSGGFDFIALRLLPGKGVSAMQPVRVVTQGADQTLPLRMVAAGVGSDVNVLLYVISEGRYEAANFNNTEVDFSKLEWSKATSSSNYDTLINAAMTQGDGRNFAVEFAGHLFTNDFAGTFKQTFDNTYYYGTTSALKCPYAQIHGPDFPQTANTWPDAGLFADAASAPDAAASDGGGGGGGGYDQCYFDDLTRATAGMNRADVFLTRLRADLKTSALDQDLVIKAASNQSTYDNIHNVTQNTDGCSTAGGDTPSRSLVVIAFGALAALLWKRRAR
jgi:hypothetical protein